MIKSIRIQDVPCYGTTPQELNDLKEHNFIFGANATGKTTISRIIANESGYPNCTITWAGETKMETLVYNTDFVNSNFKESSELKGIFTLGEENRDAIDKIKAAKSEWDTLKNSIQNLQNTLKGEGGTNGKQYELQQTEDEFKEKCWKLKLKYGDKFKVAFKGVLDAKQKFKDRLLKEDQENIATYVELAELERNAETVFSDVPTTIDAVPALIYDNLLTHESNPILKKNIIGKNDVDIAAMIQKLGNSDWVQQGRAFYKVNDGHCPFCQQPTQESFAASLSAYFDESYESDVSKIKALCDAYESDARRCVELLQMILDSPAKYLDVEKFKLQKKLIENRLRANIQAIKAKGNEPSRSIELDSLGEVLAICKSLIEQANENIQKHNNMVRNRNQEQRVLTNQVWKYMLEEDIKDDLADYKKKKSGLEKAITSLNEQISEAERKKREKEAEVRTLEKGTTSIQPTIAAINALLSEFGFTSFKLARTEKERFYKIVRDDGKPAERTLSEGEKNFITFLYFYHLLKGSETETGMTTDRVVVFDDPVSSLDSNVLFLVSTLIRGLLAEVKANSGYVKQIFVLTHNVFFHREVTYQKKGILSNPTFWMVQKQNGASKIKNYNTNPIKTSYELLWMEMRDMNSSKLTIRNTMRRILEYYFKLLGGIEFDQLLSNFEGNDKYICQSLISWMHTGSHVIGDDIYVSDEASVGQYHDVFRKVFENEGQIAHYDMMMQGAPQDASEATS